MPWRNSKCERLSWIRVQREHRWGFRGANGTRFTVTSVIIWGDQLKTLQSTLHLFLQGKGCREANIKSQSQVEIDQVFDVGKISFFPNPRSFPLPDDTDIMCFIETQRRAGETAQAHHPNAESSVLSAYLKACVCKVSLCWI